MTEKFEVYICNYIKNQTESFKKYLLAAFESKDKSICYLDESLGTPVPSTDIRNCELLADTQLFREEITLTRDGRNRYKVFYLTDLGKEMAEQIKKEYSSEMAESPDVTST